MHLYFEPFLCVCVHACVRVWGGACKGLLKKNTADFTLRVEGGDF
jgi:hypothetical protein